MTIAIQCVLLFGLLISTLLLFLMVRQIGVLSRRIKVRSKGRAPALDRGTPIPVTEFASIDEKDVYRVPVTGSGDTNLLFVSFSCPTCREIMDKLVELPAAKVARTILLFLDGGVRLEHGEELRRLRDAGLRMVEGQLLAEKFAVSRAPIVFVVSEDGVIKQRDGLLSFEDFEAATA
jgi:hypothetical protein